MPEFYGSMTHIARINFKCEADSLEEAKEKMLTAFPEAGHLYQDGKIVGTIEGYDDWHNVNEPARGNVMEYCVSGIDIEQEKE